MALPLVAWAIRIYRADRGAIATWSRTALILWSLALTIGAVSWLNGNSSGKLFLDWTGYARVLFPLAILFLWMVLAAGYKQAWHEPENRSPLIRASKTAWPRGAFARSPGHLPCLRSGHVSCDQSRYRRPDGSEPARVHARHRPHPLLVALRPYSSQNHRPQLDRRRLGRLRHRGRALPRPGPRRREPPPARADSSASAAC